MATFGAVDIEPVHEPSSIRVDETKSFEYRIGATGTNAGTEPIFNPDPDQCASPELVYGFGVDMVAEFNGDRVDSESTCLSNANATRTPHYFTFTLEGSTPGDGTLSIEVTGRDTGNTLATRTVDLSVVDPDSGGGGGGGGVNPGGGSGGGSGDDDRFRWPWEDGDGGGSDGVLADAESVIKWAVILSVIYLVASKVNFPEIDLAELGDGL